MRNFHFFLLGTRISWTRWDEREGGRKQRNTQKRKETVTKRSHARRKNTNDFVFYCIQMKVRQKQGLQQKEFADWPRMVSMAGLRFPSPWVAAGYCCLHSAGWDCSFCGHKTGRRGRS